MCDPQNGRSYHDAQPGRYRRVDSVAFSSHSKTTRPLPNPRSLPGAAEASLSHKNREQQKPVRSVRLTSR